MANAQSVGSHEWAQRLYDIVAPAVAAAVKDAEGREGAGPDALARYAGTYARALGRRGGRAALGGRPRHARAPDR